MRALRLAIVVLLSVGITLLPVAAAVQHTHAAMCMQLVDAQHGDCGCCGEAAPCVQAPCGAQCLSTQAALPVDNRLSSPSRANLRVAHSAIPRSLMLTPDPPPPRA